MAGDDVGCNAFWPVATVETRTTRYFELGAEGDWHPSEVASDAVLEIREFR